MKKLVKAVFAIFVIALMTGCPKSTDEPEKDKTVQEDDQDKNKDQNKDTTDQTNPDDDEDSGDQTDTNQDNNNTDQDEDQDDETTPKPRQEVSGKLGTYEAPYEVGDIVFKDGSATPYTQGLNLTAEQKAAAVSIIFYKGNNLNSDVNYKTDTSITRTLGIGLLHSEDYTNSEGSSRIPWCHEDSQGAVNEITTIEASNSRPDGELIFFEDINGSDNLEQISSFLAGEHEKDDRIFDDTSDPEMYPAFYFAKNYKDVEGSRVKGTAFETGWYLPTIAEIWQVCKQKDTIESASELCGGSKFVMSGHDNEEYYLRPYYYWTSTQGRQYRANSAYYAEIFSFYHESYDTYSKVMDCYVIAIREF